MGGGKNSTIQTPSEVANFIFSIVNDHIDKNKPVFDPCVGEGSLLQPFCDSGYKTIGIDVEEQGFPNTIKQNYLTIRPEDIKEPSLVIMNPPFNIDDKTREYVKTHYGFRPLLPELWLARTVELFGKDVPIVLFTPYGLRLNLTEKSRRWKMFTSGMYPEICSIISLPKNVFDGILFHSEILIFNVKNIKGHYFLNGNI